MADPFTSPWSDILARLYNCGPTPRVALRLGVGLTNWELKRHSMYLKQRGLLDIRNGIFWLTPKGIAKHEQDSGLSLEPSF